MANSNVMFISFICSYTFEMSLVPQKLSKSRNTVSESLLSELQKVLKLGFWKEVQLISGVFKDKILNRNQVQSYQIYIKEAMIARKLYDFRVIFKELMPCIKWSTISISLSSWLPKTVLYLRPFSHYWGNSKFQNSEITFSNCYWLAIEFINFIWNKYTYLYKTSHLKITNSFNICNLSWAQRKISDNVEGGGRDDLSSEEAIFAVIANSRHKEVNTSRSSHLTSDMYLYFL